MSGLNLSGSWSGCYSYPTARPSVPFEAQLKDESGHVTGTISESHEFTGARISAVLDGRRSGRGVSFAKMYERADEAYDSAHYSGEVSAEGDEISGRWHIPGVWDGTFLMIRAPGSAATVEEKANERV